ncbi:hypothetical protein, partial [Segatella sp.]|uniref:hypothetical protein n=1 Tax=Segatella sp. TaxID=2974253 RepID=UPI00307F5B41
CRFASKIPLNPIGCGFEVYIRFKIYPSPFTSSPQHISIIVFPTFVFLVYSSEISHYLSEKFSYSSEIFCYLSEIFSYSSEIFCYLSE